MAAFHWSDSRTCYGVLGNGVNVNGEEYCDLATEANIRACAPSLSEADIAEAHARMEALLSADITACSQ